MNDAERSGGSSNKVYSILEFVGILAILPGGAYLLLRFYYSLDMLNIRIDSIMYGAPLTANALAAGMTVTLISAGALVGVAVTLRMCGRLSRVASWAVVAPVLAGVAASAYTGERQSRHIREHACRVKLRNTGAGHHLRDDVTPGTLPVHAFYYNDRHELWLYPRLTSETVNAAIEYYRISGMELERQ